MSVISIVLIGFSCFFFGTFIGCMLTAILTSNKITNLYEEINRLSTELNGDKQ